ncbi:MAG: hypothetical protein PHE55_20440 [Methylococcaceae bacterium]|nr:hypothetical protein [Methylococcaceae bacterium]
MGIERINRRASVIGGTGLGGRQQSPVVARGPMFAGYDIPPQEVAELYKLYTQTGGPSWINHTNWFENKQCATWYGLTVAGGRVTAIDLRDNNLAGVTSFSPKPFLALTHLYAHKSTSNTTLSLRFALADLPASMQLFYAYATASLITGATSDFPATMHSISIRNTPSMITGPLADLTANMINFSVSTTQSLITGGASAMAAIAIDDIRLQTCPNMTIAAKDDIINRLYADRALFTNAAHDLNISGGEGPLTGVYQTSAAPSTPAEKAYALVNDQNAEGFLKWAITL